MLRYLRPSAFKYIYNMYKITVVFGNWAVVRMAWHLIYSSFKTEKSLAISLDRQYSKIMERLELDGHAWKNVM